MYVGVTSCCVGVDRRGVEEDVEVIRVQRETREKSDRILVLESQYSAMERVRVIATPSLYAVILLSVKLPKKDLHKKDTSLWRALDSAQY